MQSSVLAVVALSMGAGAQDPKRNGAGALSGLIVSTLFIPPVGIIVGASNLQEELRKEQARTLLVLGVIMVCVNVLILLGS